MNFFKLILNHFFPKKVEPTKEDLINQWVDDELETTVKRHRKFLDLKPTKRKVDVIVVHCTGSELDVGVKEIREWHKKRGFRDIGYHYVIRKDCTLEIGRPIGMRGAHCPEANATGIGVCVVGNKNFSDGQLHAVKGLIKVLKDIHKINKVRGHRDYPSAQKQGKTCPGFNVRDVLQGRYK